MPISEEYTVTDQSGYSIRQMMDADLDQARAVMYRSVIEDFREEPNPRIHSDIDDLVGWYGQGGGPFMLVAVDDATGQVIATAGVRGGELKEGLSPQHLVEAYRDGRTGQLVRVYVLREYRRRGIAQKLVEAVLDKTRSDGFYDRIVLHTYQHSPGAVSFWTSMGAVLVEDDTHGISQAVFFELPSSQQAGAPTR
jgi:GNAT superfamily N-acetyltransferase